MPLRRGVPSEVRNAGSQSSHDAAPGQDRARAGRRACRLGALPPALAHQSGQLEAWRSTVEAVLGPMPAIANTPFFGLTLLSGAALAAQSDWVRQSDNPVLRAFRQQPLIQEAGRYASVPLFSLLVGLTLVGYFVNSGKIRGVAGKILRLVEDGSSWLIYAALAVGLVGSSPHPAATTQAALGLTGEPLAIATSCGLAIGLAAMMVVRYSLDLMVWMMPVPFLDFLFETLKKLLSLCYLLLALLAPGLTAVISFALLVAALIAVRWSIGFVRSALRRLGRMINPEPGQA
jgi:hypothetical protein